MSSMNDGDSDARFERVDWSEIDRSRRLLTAERSVFLGGVLAVAALYLYDWYVAHVYLVGSWNAERIDWVFMLATVVLIAYGVVPLLQRRESVRRVLGRLRSRPITVGALGYLLVFVVVGFVGPALVSNPGLRFQHAFHPPVGFTSEIVRVECVGRVTGPPFERQCHGSWTYPLGTNERGHPMEFLLVQGTRTALYVTAITAAFVVPLATAVGVVAGLRGGLLDGLLMSYVDVQLSIPAIVAYFVGYAYWNPSLLLLVAAFGFLSWGGIARLVRSEVLQRRENGHVRVARSLGASNRYIARRHIVPNITNTLVPAVCQLLALLILFEAGVAFLGFHEIEVYSWGSIISESVNAEVDGQLQNRAEYPAYQLWWVSTLPALALTATMLSFKLVGDGLRDALDPRGER